MRFEGSVGIDPAMAGPVLPADGTQVARGAGDCTVCELCQRLADIRPWCRADEPSTAVLARRPIFVPR